jgi:hypothetical protein
LNEYAHGGDGDIRVEAGRHQVLVAQEIADLAQVCPARVKPGGESPSQDVRPAVGSGKPTTAVSAPHGHPHAMGADRGSGHLGVPQKYAVTLAGSTETFNLKNA